MSLVEKIADDFYKDGVGVCDNFISASEVSLLLEEFEKQKNSLQKAGIGNKENFQIKNEVRGDFIKWIDPEEKLFKDIYFSRLQPVIELFNRRFYLGISKNEHHLAYYPAGTHYEKHVDTFKNTDARVVSSVLYLNTHWKADDGGELGIYPPTLSDPGPLRTGPEKKDAIKIEPFAGRLVLFESTLPHEVLPNKMPRYSITGWFKRDSLL